MNKRIKTPNRPNWQLLKEEFLTSNLSVADFLRTKEIDPLSGTSKRATTGWVDYRGTFRRQQADIARQELAELGAQAIVNIDSALFSMASLIIPALERYVREKGVLSPKEAQILHTLVLLRTSQPV